MRRPFDQAHRIPFGLQQCRQIPLQARIRHRCLLPPTPGLADPPLRSDSFSREFFDPSLDRLPIRSRARCYLTDTTRADLERFCSQMQAPLLLIQFVPQDLVLLLCRHSLTIPYFPVFWKLFADEPLVQRGGILLGPFTDSPDTCRRHLRRPLQFLVWWEFHILAAGASDTLALDLVGQPHFHADRAASIVSCALAFLSLSKSGARRHLVGLLRARILEGASRRLLEGASP